MKMVCGVGFNDEKYPAAINKKQIKEHKLWCAMISRCYCNKVKEKMPAYKDCTTSENFKSYSYFYEWCQNQIGFGLSGWELDKDLLSKNNKTYSEDVCVFLPSEINTLINRQRGSRGNHPIGVCFSKEKKKYRAEMRTKMKRNHLGYFDCPIEAFNAYKESKELYIKSVAKLYKDHIDPRAYDALMNYQVEITD